METGFSQRKRELAVERFQARVWFQSDGSTSQASSKSRNMGIARLVRGFLFSHRFRGKPVSVFPHDAIVGGHPCAEEIDPMTSPADRLNQIATLRIELLDTDPPIWRQVEVPTSITLKVLHEVVQAAMDWRNQHLWALDFDERRYGEAVLSEDEDGSSIIRADKVRLRDVLKSAGTVMDYVYDFGDNWEHRLTFSHIRSGDPDVNYPRYVAGERCAPLEDCGGVPGFYDALEILADPADPDHADVADFFEDFDPDRIDEQVLGFALSRIARRYDAARATWK